MPNSTLDDENEQILKFNQSYDQYTQYLEVVKKLKYAINLSSGDNVSVVVQQLLTKNYSLIDAVLKKSSASFKEVQANFSEHIRNAMDNIPENRDKVKVVQILLTEAAKHDKNLLPNLLKVQDQYRRPPFHLIARYGTEEEVKSLVDMSPRYMDDKLLKHMLNATDGWGETPLHNAVRSSFGQITIELLVKSGADIDAKDKRGNTPLHLATYENNPRLIKLLMALGAKRNIQNNRGEDAKTAVIKTVTNYYQENGETLPRQLQQYLINQPGKVAISASPPPKRRNTGRGV